LISPCFKNILNKTTRQRWYQKVKHQIFGDGWSILEKKNDPASGGRQNDILVFSMLLHSSPNI
jgi:hypothetical protein